MDLGEIYSNKKRILNEGYMEFYNTIRDDLENDEDFTLADDEMGELIVDLMLSNVLGEITTFDEVSNLLSLERQKETKDTSDSIIKEELKTKANNIGIIDKEIKNKINECWEYHKDILKQDGYKKSDIGNIDLSSEGWEDIHFFEGVIYGLELAKEMINN